MPELGHQADLAIRLLVAAVLGALIGVERERHERPAGMRTHLLVSVGSALFTVLSIDAFPSPGADPARIAAQVVTGIGFLGAGAIIKDGITVKGLTTAASLWVVAAVGMAAGAAAWGVAIAATIIVLVSLWPLRVIEDAYFPHHRHPGGVVHEGAVHEGPVDEGAAAVDQPVHGDQARSPDAR